MRNVIWRLMASASAMIVFSSLGLAQFGSIAGVVKDNSGASSRTSQWKPRVLC